MKNLGWLYNKDYYSFLLSEDRINSLSSEMPVKDQEILEQCFEGKNNQIESEKWSKTWSQIPNTDCFSLKTLYPGLVTGIGIFHETGLKGECKLGIQFDFTTGLPYIPGSSVKGLIRSVFPETKGILAKQRAEYIITLCENKLKTIDDVIELKNHIFDGLDKQDNAIPLQKRDIFLDAMVEKSGRNGLLGFDYITPHHSPDLLHNPIPIKFLKIKPDVTFTFYFKSTDTILKNGVIFTSLDKLSLYKKILLDIGIGAKTNVGYGQFVETRN